MEAPTTEDARKGKVVCPQSTLDSAERRGFIRKAAMVTAAVGVGGTILGKNLIPESSAKSALRGVTTPGCNVSGTLAVWNGSVEITDSGPASLIGSSLCPIILGTNKGLGIGVQGNAGGNACCGYGTGVLGISFGGYGVQGSSYEFRGVYGCSFHGTGVFGVSHYGAGIRGCSYCGIGVQATGLTYGVYGCSSCLEGHIGVYGKGLVSGVQGSSCARAGVFGCSNIGTGVLASSNTGTAILGTSSGGVGVYGCSICATGVDGHSRFGNGVFGETSAVCGTGVEGLATSLSGSTIGVCGQALSPSGIGVRGIGGQCGSGGIGVQGWAFCPSTIPIVAKSASKQTANLMQFEKSCSAPLSVFNPCGWLGIGTSSPQNTLQVNGGVSYAIATKTASYTMANTDYAILANATSGVLTITLPAATYAGMVVNIKKIDSSKNAVKVSAGSYKIEGKASESLTKQYDGLTLIADGVGTWYELSTSK